MTVDTTEIYEAVPDTELIENSEVLNVQGEESISQGVKEDNTEVVTISKVYQLRKDMALLGAK